MPPGSAPVRPWDRCRNSGASARTRLIGIGPLDPGDLVTSRKLAASRARPPSDSAPDATPGRKRPTINDIARLANVSKKTVSRVINDSPFVREETREKIAGIIKELGFAPDPQARGLA